MIARWIDLCARNRFLVFTGTLLLVLAGVWAERRMPLDALPDISDVQVIIHTAWNEPPNVIEDQVTYGAALFETRDFRFDLGLEFGSLISFAAGLAARDILFDLFDKSEVLGEGWRSANPGERGRFRPQRCKRR